MRKKEMTLKNIMENSLEAKSIENKIKETQEIKLKLLNKDNRIEIKNFRIHNLILEEIKKNKVQFRKLIRLAYAIRKGLRNDYDFVAVMSGREGRGKSTLLIILSALIDITFVMEKRLSLMPQTHEIKRLFKKTRRFGVLGIDEAIKGLHKQDWYSDVQKEIVKLYATERFQNKATLMCIPRFRDINENFRNHRVNCWINVIERGHAFIYVPIDIPYFVNPWFFEEMEKKYKKLFAIKRGSDVTLNDMLKLEKKNPCFVDYIEFPDLPKEVKEAYLQLKIEAREKEERGETIEISKDKLRNSLALQIYLDMANGMQRKAVMDKYRISASFISTLKKEGFILRKKELQETMSKENTLYG